MSDSELLNSDSKDFEIQLALDERLDTGLLQVLKKKFPEITRKDIKHAIEQGWIQKRSPRGPERLNPTLRGSATHGPIPLEIQWQLLQSSWIKPEILPRVEGCDLEILFEDEHLLVLDKRSGMPSCPLTLKEQGTAVHHALAHFGELPKTHPKEPGLLHRLDTGTSGCLAFAKTQESFDRLKHDWKKGQVKKYYLAHVLAADFNSLGLTLPFEITLPLGHDPKSSKRMRVASEKKPDAIRGKALPARTTLLGARIAGEKVQLEIQLHTGVMHQIRVHLAHLGIPILGDPLYGGAPADRLQLHCEKLIFLNHPKIQVISHSQKTFGRLPVA